MYMFDGSCYFLPFLFGPLILILLSGKKNGAHTQAALEEASPLSAASAFCMWFFRGFFILSLLRELAAA